MKSTDIAKTKVLFITYSLNMGGAEKVFSLISSHLNEKSFEVYYLVINNDTSDIFRLNPNITFFSLNRKRTIFSFFNIYQKIKFINPDTVIVTLAPVIITVGLIRLFFGLRDIKFIFRETAIPSLNNYFSNKPAFLLNWISRIVYNYYDLVIAQSQDMMDDLVINYNLNKNKIVIIRNPVFLNVKKNILQSYKSSDCKTFITVGNLRREKGHLRILDVIFKLKGKLNFRYLIIGDGVMRPLIEEKIKNLQLESEVILVGHKADVGQYLFDADLFLQGSYYEGFPNALLEACAYGVPIIAYDVPGGTKEIVINDFNGFLIKNDDSTLFANTIIHSINHDFNRSHISESITNKFSFEKILLQYQELLRHV